MGLSVAVLVSNGRHPISGRARACPGDVAALEVARKLGGSLNVFHIGDGDPLVLQDYLAYGAARITVLNAGALAEDTAAEWLKTFDLIVTGTRTESGEGSGLLPYLIAKRLDRPIVANVLDASVAGGEAIVRQFLPKGKRRPVSASLPAVLAVHPLAPVSPRYAHARKMQGHIDRAATSVAAENAATSAPWALSPADKQLVKLKAQEKKAGHARMLSAVAAEAKGGIVAIEGSDVEKAQMLLAYLREHRLIDF